MNYWVSIHQLNTQGLARSRLCQRIINHVDNYITRFQGLNTRSDRLVHIHIVSLNVTYKVSYPCLEQVQPPVDNRWYMYQQLSYLLITFILLQSNVDLVYLQQADVCAIIAQKINLL